MTQPVPVIHLVLLAGGKGLRAGGGEVPKQFRPTGRGLLFTVSLASFLRLPAEGGRIASVTVTVPEAWSDTAAAALANLRDLSSQPRLPIQLALAGETRTASTWNALSRLAERAPAPDDLVAVHDAARPFAGADLLGRLARSAAQAGAAVPAVPVADTIVELDAEQRAHYLVRSRLAAVQTPQVFRWDLLYAAHEEAARQGADHTDDGGLLAARGCDPAVVEGSQDNWKITTESDWRRAEELLADLPPGWI